MIDMHYDLLTIAYLAMKNNQLQEFEKDYNVIYNNQNIIGGIVNLYFMSRDEMENELHIMKTEEINVIDMFEKSVNVVKNNIKLFSNNKFLFGIEGCDYLENIEDLSKLYNLGLRSIIPVWNEANKFGSGTRSDKGLTPLGASLINKAIDLGIAIDLSHANEKTFYDIISVVKSRKLVGDKIVIYASHSNSRKLCNVKRNLTDEQIRSLSEIGGSLGLVEYKAFVTTDNQSKKKEFYIAEYIKNIVHAITIIGIDNIFLASDDMDFMSKYGFDNSCKEQSIFNFNEIRRELALSLSKYGFKKAEIDKILYINGSRIINNICSLEINALKDGNNYIK
jgi:membrane dipeptidase